MEYKLAKDTVPQRILITSDDSIIEYQRTIPKNKSNPQEMYVYKFIESKEKKDMEFEMTPDFLDKQLTNFFKVV